MTRQWAPLPSTGDTIDVTLDLSFMPTDHFIAAVSISALDPTDYRSLGRVEGRLMHRHDGRDTPTISARVGWLIVAVATKALDGHEIPQHFHIFLSIGSGKLRHIGSTDSLRQYFSVNGPLLQLGTHPEQEVVRSAIIETAETDSKVTVERDMTVSWPIWEKWTPGADRNSLREEDGCVLITGAPRRNLVTVITARGEVIRKRADVVDTISDHVKAQVERENRERAVEKAENDARLLIDFRHRLHNETTSLWSSMRKARGDRRVILDTLELFMPTMEDGEDDLLVEGAWSAEWRLRYWDLLPYLVEALPAGAARAEAQRMCDTRPPEDADHRT